VRDLNPAHADNKKQKNKNGRNFIMKRTNTFKSSLIKRAASFATAIAVTATSAGITEFANLTAPAQNEPFPYAIFAEGSVTVNGQGFSFNGNAYAKGEWSINTQNQHINGTVTIPEIPSVSTQPA
jgi:hypothetical protein